MGQARRKREIGRGERILPGVWRLRLPLPWPGVPHGNAFAVAAGDGIVLFDTGMAADDGMRQLEIALAQAGWRVEDVQLVVCTHAHSDHYGLAAPILDRAGCELWMHPAWGHIRAIAEDPDARARPADRGRTPVRGAGRRRSSSMSSAAASDPGDRRDSSSPTASCCPASRSRPTSAPGRSTRRPDTRPRTSSFTSPSAAS